MANFFAGVPMIYQTPLEEQRTNVAIGSDLGRNFIDGYLRSKAQRFDEQRWEDQADLRKAQVTSMLTQNDLNKIRIQTESLANAKRARIESSMSDALAAEEGWSQIGFGDPVVQSEFANFLSRNPHLDGTPWAQGVRTMISSAKNNAFEAEKLKQEWQVRKEIAGMRPERLDEDQRMDIQAANAYADGMVSSGEWTPQQALEFKNSERMRITGSSGTAVQPATEGKGRQVTVNGVTFWVKDGSGVTAAPPGVAPVENESAPSIEGKPWGTRSFYETMTTREAQERVEKNKPYVQSQRGLNKFGMVRENQRSLLDAIKSLPW